MAGPARSGAFIYGKDIRALSQFYVDVVDMQKMHATEEMVVLNTLDLQVIIHKMPAEIDASVEISVPPVVREGVIKLFFGVTSIEDARDIAKRLGGEVYPEVWSGPGFNVCNACDPEGNIFQVRELIP